jgi:hypothetical protein
MNLDVKLLVGRLVSTFFYARIEDPILEWRSILKNYLRLLFFVGQVCQHLYRLIVLI